MKKKTKKQLWDLIQKQFSKTCKKKEDCWKNQNIVKRLNDVEINKYTFKPEYPKEWRKINILG